MADFVASMGVPFLACVVLVGIHVYLGMHVLTREIIFVDLALAQIAALGSVVGALLGYSKDLAPWTNKGLAVSFAVAGALIFSITRQKKERIAHEAIIGIAYAVALSVTILLSSQMPHGADELRELLSGNILWVDSREVLHTALLYGLVGVIHFVFRKKFFAISKDAKAAQQQGINVLGWDFLFYVTFGVVVTSSVSIVGVLLVFSFLVIPASIAFLLSEHLGRRLWLGWGVGVLVSALGLIASYQMDLPTGPTIVVMLGLALVLVASAKKLISRA